MTARIRIGVWLSSTPHGGGFFQYAVMTLRALSAIRKRQPDRYELMCLSPNNEWRGFVAENCPECVGDFQVVGRNLIQKAASRMVRVSNVGLHVWRTLNRIVPLTYAALDRSKVDLIVCTSPEALASEIRIPVIAPIHDLMHRYEPSFPEVGSPRMVRQRDRLFRSMCRFCRVLLADSELGKRHILESYGEVLKADVMALPFLPASYILDHDARRDYSWVRGKYGLPEHYIFYPAQFWEHKNHGRLLDAISLLRQKGMIVNAVFVGSEKNSLSRVSRHIAELGLGEQVNILGYVPDDDIIGLYKNARALVMPTFFGPTNIPPLEAFSLGVPVACSGIYAMSEQVGDAALLFDPKRSEDIAEKVRRLWVDGELRCELIERGRERMRDMTFDKYVTRWEDVLRAALDSTDIRHTGRSERIRRALNHEPAQCA